MISETKVHHACLLMEAVSPTSEALLEPGAPQSPRDGEFTEKSPSAFAVLCLSLVLAVLSSPSPLTLHDYNTGGARPWS